MLKLGYFHGNFSTSETFIYDLVKSLSEDKDIDLYYISYLKKHINVDFNLNYIPAGYWEKYDKIDSYLYKLGQVLGRRGSLFRFNFRNRIIKNTLI